MKIANFSFWLGLSIALFTSPTIVWADEIVGDSNSTSTAVATTTEHVIPSSLQDETQQSPEQSPNVNTSTATDNLIESSTTTPETPTSSPSSKEENIDGAVTSTIDTATSTVILNDSEETLNDTVSPTTTATSTDTNADIGNGPSGGNETVNQTIPTEEINGAIQKILNYFKSQQSADGKIIDGNITDWAIMSYGANNQYADEIKNSTSSLLDYEKNYNLDDPSDLNSCASYPRHILALLSAGVNKNDTTIQGLKNKMLTVCYQNNLYGLHGINDDVFGLIALLALDTNSAEQIIKDIVSTTKSWQIDSGAFSWPDWDPNSTTKIAGDDITGAAMNALKYAQTKGVEIDNEIFAKAKAYLKSTQQTDGGWGWGASDIMTTSWVLMGINALGENQNEWFNSASKNPWHPLLAQLKEGGYYESAWVPGTTDWFAGKHAVPALAGKSWPIILPEKIARFEAGPNITFGGGPIYYPPVVLTATTTSPTSTLIEITATTTIVTATTTSTTTSFENNLNNSNVQTVSSTPTNTTKKRIIKKPVKIVPKITQIIPEVKGEKITSPPQELSSRGVTTTTDLSPNNVQPKTKENILVKSAKWIWGLLKNLL